MPETDTGLEYATYNIALKAAVNTGRYEQQAEALGVKFDGDDADAASNYTLMQAAIDDLSSQGGGRLILASDGHMKINHAISLRPGVIVDGRGCLTDNILTRAGTPDDNFGQDATYLTGGFAKSDHDEHTWNKLDAVTAGADEVTLSTVSEADNYELDDIVMIVEANGTWGDGVNAQPAQAEIARVVGKSGGVLQLEHHNTLATDVVAGAGTIAVNPTGAWIANVDYRTAGAKTGGDWVDTRFVLKDAALVNHRLLQSGQDGTQNTAIFGMRSGVYNCHVENIEATGMVANVMFGNGYVNSHYHNIRGPYIRRAIELKYLAQNSRFTDLRMWKRNHGFDAAFDEDPPLTIGEDSKFITVENPRIDVGNWNDDGSGLNLIAFTNARDCRVINPQITGKALFASAISFPDDGSNEPNATRCAVLGGAISVPTSVTIEDSGQDCRVDGVTFTGAISTFAYRRGSAGRGGEVLSNCFTEESGAKTLAIAGATADSAVVLAGNRGITALDNAAARRIVMRDTLTSTWEAIIAAGAQALDVSEHTTSSTTEVALGDSVIVPAAAAAVGDVFGWSAVGTCSGSAGTRTLKWRASVDTDDDAAILDTDDDTNIAGTVALPSTCTSWTLEASATITTASRIVTRLKVTDLTNGDALGEVIRHVSADFANFPLIFTLSGFVADGADSINARVTGRTATRAGYI